MSDGLYLGLISGTSRDGLDLVLTESRDGQLEVLSTACHPYPDSLRRTVNQLIESGNRPSRQSLAEPHAVMAAFIATAVQVFLQEQDLGAEHITALGSHGQTVWHEPSGADPVSIQLGDGELIARLTGIPTVSDFRTADVQAGGEGAPLAPLIHDRLYRHADERRIILNLGGIANLTLLAPGEPVSGFDSGPANCLMDAWIGQEKSLSYDDRGRWAATGQCSEELLQRMLEEPYFRMNPPKSTGLELFNKGWLETKLDGISLSSQDVQRSLLELTVRTVIDGLDQWAPDRVLVCGGGVHNEFLMQRMGIELMPTPVESIRALGADPDSVEALLFAWLARERLSHTLHDTTPITGAGKPVMLGALHKPS